MTSLCGVTRASGSSRLDRTAASRSTRSTLQIRAPTCARPAASVDWPATFLRSSSRMTQHPVRIHRRPYETERSNQMFFCLFFLPSLHCCDWTEESLLSESNKKFFVFHDWGVSVYEPQNCRLLHMIQSTDIMPGTQVSGFPIDIPHASC